jgi:hypothetical protein
MKLNGSLNYTIDGYNVARSGYLLLGAGAPPSTALFNNPNLGAYSQLHLTGRNGAFIQTGGHRPWMETGITFTDNQDLSYIGLRKVGSGLDITETVIGWADNSGTGVGPDCVTFRFFGTGSGSSTIANDLQNVNDYDGLHVATFSPSGEFGLGNTFGVDAPNFYVRPASLAHFSLDKQRSVWQQFTNRNTVYNSGTGEFASDGLRIGIIGNSNPFINGTAAMYNQELRPILFSTNANTTNMNLANGTTHERMRIMSVSTPTNLINGIFAAYNPAGLPANTTRVSISHNPSKPITRPLSLLHLGYNTGSTTPLFMNTDGWRDWMDIGAFISNGTDNMYIGLKKEGATDKNDAVINWGDNQSNGNIQGPDHLRFIFTSSPNSIFFPGDSVSASQNGLETMRIVPFRDTTTALQGLTYGRVGIGDFTASGVNQEPTHKLDVVGNGRFRALPDSLYFADSSVNKIVMVDSNGVLRWKSFIPSEFGTNCTDTINGKLDSDKKVVLNNHNLYFTNHPDSIDLFNNRIGIGYLCGTTLPGKLATRQLHDQTVSYSTTAGHFHNSDTANQINLRFIGTIGRADGQQIPNLRSWNIGGSFSGSSADINIGIQANAQADSMTSSNNMGGQLSAFKGNVATGLMAQGSTGLYRSIGVFGIGTSPLNLSQLENIGGQFSGSWNLTNNYGVKAVANGGQHSIGIYATANSAPLNHAGYFNGNVEVINGTYISDQQFKTNISSIEGGLKTLIQLKPVSYDFNLANFPQFNFDNKHHLGFIAQDVENVIPDLVYDSELPAEFDSLGNEISPSTTYKTLNYNGIIPLNTQAIIELNQKVEKNDLSDGTVKTNVQDITGSLEKVLQMHGVSYDWNHSVHPELNLDSANHIGFIAQEIEQIDNRLTYLGSDSLYHVEYDKVVPILAEAISELNDTIVIRDSIISAQGAQIQDLNNRLTQLENCLSGILPFLCQLSHQAVQANTPAAQEEIRKTLEVKLSNKDVIVLDQNVPNPFAEQTVINFSIPESVKKAQILFHDGMGKLLQAVDIQQRGLGSITVFGSDLSAGTYTYTLVADGINVATKRMVKY